MVKIVNSMSNPHTFNNIPSFPPSVADMNSCGYPKVTAIGNKIPVINPLNLNQLKPLTIKDLSSMASMSLHDIHNPNIKRYEVMESTEDLLALSVAWRRIRKSAPRYKNFIISTLIDQILFKHLIPKDKIDADIIRNYYQQKLLILAIKNSKLTTFRKDLKVYIQGDGTRFKETDLPMIFRLPEFYEYDIEFDKLKQTVKVNASAITNTVEMASKFTKELIPLKHFTRHKNKVKRHEYWLKDQEDHAYLITIDDANPLQHMWDKEFTKSSLYINAYFSQKIQDDFHYFKPLSWTLA